MKKLLLKTLVFFILLCVNKLDAQIVEFQEVLPSSPIPEIIEYFENVNLSSIAFADIDGDNDQDVLIIGSSLILDRVAKLYRNNGLGGYTLIYNFEGVSSGSTAFADIDGDNDQDLLITGYTGTVAVSKLYINDGSGAYSLVSGTPFLGAYYSSVAFADVDGDNDQDVLITGTDGTGITSNLYTNDGSGNFSLITGTPFDGVYIGSIAFSDIDSDNDQDVLITGYTGDVAVSKLYVNDGSGVYSLVSGTPFQGVYYSSIAFTDIDGDNDQDLLITGSNGTIATSNLYTNNGSGGFGLVSGTPFDEVFRGSIAFTDIDNDYDQDVLITGYNGSNNVAKLYSNNGSGSFSLVANTVMEGVYNGSVAFSDIDGDNNQDLLITGYNIETSRRISKLYSNIGSGEFNFVTSTPPFDGVQTSSLAFIDIDGDNDQDVLITGRNDFIQATSRLYKNDGNGEYSMISGMPFGGVEGQMVLADIDGDNDKDVLITGSRTGDGYITELYRNEGDGMFSLVTGGATLETFLGGSAAFSDFDEDNDLDLFITGYVSGGSSGLISQSIYENDGNGIYYFITSSSDLGVSRGEIAFADIDGDNDEDMFVTGEEGIDGGRTARYYINNGINSGTFQFTLGQSFEPVLNSSIAFADIDGDNDLDVLIIGENTAREAIANLYKNDGIGMFSLVSIEDAPFEGAKGGSIAFADIDGDNDQDVFITGITGGFSSSEQTSKLYKNNGSGVFSLVSGMPFDAVINGSIAFTDIDGDNDQDLIISGGIGTGYPGNGIVKLYRNITNTLSVTPIDNSNVKLEIYPNPTNNMLTFNTNNVIQSIQIYNLLGQAMKKIDRETITNNQIDVSNYASGIYLMHIQIEGKTQVIRFIKK